MPRILDEGPLGNNAGFDADVNPTVSVEFSTAAFRFGHTLLSPTIQRLAENGNNPADALDLRVAFFNPGSFAETGVDPILRGLADGKSQAYDPMLVKDVRSFLFGQPGAGGFDLASLNIPRGLEHGLQSYNDMQEALRLDRKASFAEIPSNPDIAARLEEAYGDVDLIDARVSGLAEDRFGDGLVSELFHLVIADQFNRVRAGNKYSSENNPLPDIAQGIGFNLLSDVIKANTGVEVMQDDVLPSYVRKGFGDDNDIVIGTQDRDLLSGGVGNDILYGRGNDDYLDGGNGYDTLNGGAGDDVLFGQNGDDAIQDGAGFDLMYASNGEDTLYGGADGDKLYSYYGQVHLYGGYGEDYLYGGSDGDVLDGDVGNERVYGQRADDDLSGCDRRDILRSGDGDDRLESGAGYDGLRGDHGHDAFVFQGAFGYDRIRGFEEGDTL